MFTEQQLEAARAMTRKLDDEISTVLNELWPDPWTLEDVKRRCSILGVAGNPVRTLYVDGVPRLEIWPIEVEREQTATGWTMRLKQNFRRLSSESTG